MGHVTVKWLWNHKIVRSSFERMFYNLRNKTLSCKATVFVL